MVTRTKPISKNRDPSLLSAAPFDDDALSLHSDQELDSSDDEVLAGARTSTEIRDHDRSILLEEEERNEMLLKAGRSGPQPSSQLKNIFGKAYTSSSLKNGDRDGELVAGRKDQRKKRRTRRKEMKEKLLDDAAHGEDRGLMYEMEEGGLKEGSSTGESSETEGSSEVDHRGLDHLGDAKRSRRRNWRCWCFIHLLISIGFSILVLGAWRLSLGKKKPAVQKMFNNGTALFAPTTILISLDGFRADFLKRGITPRLSAFIEEGVSPIYMTPSFPSVTFPNHYTLVTGLYPESHGVVGNTFWDPILQQEFYYTDPARSLQGKWWGGEPLWVTAEKQGIRTAIHMWPGSEAHIMELEPSFLDKFNGTEELSKKVDRVLELLDKPGLEDTNALVENMRPQLIAAYVPNVDTDGHMFGPNTTEIRTTIESVDTMLNELFAGLEARNLTDVVNVVVVSDHGMATTSTDRLIQLEDLIDLEKIEHTDGWPLYGLRPKDPADLQGLYDDLASKVAEYQNYEVYLRDVNMPERYHFSKNQRIAPLWIVPKTGWAIVTKDTFNVEEAKAQGTVFHPRGLHGYDHEHPLMRAIFVARGPAFPHAPNSRVEVFQNIEVYNIVCDSLGLDPRPNNGTIRLPFKPVGIHSPETSPVEPEDPVPSSISETVNSTPSTKTIEEVASIISISPLETSSAADPSTAPPTFVGVDEPKETDESKTEEPTTDDLWAYLLGKIDGFRSWFGGIVKGGKGKGDTVEVTEVHDSGSE